VEEEAKRRLLASKKLSLVVDLDQTIIHATVDPTVEEWQNDEDNPNHEAVKDVKKFKLVDDGPGARGCWYYIKLRPGLKEFWRMSRSCTSCTYTPWELGCMHKISQTSLIRTERYSGIEFSVEMRVAA
jgi:TFIIF-interacting CTD phosphatase-like protein